MIFSTPCKSGDNSRQGGGWRGLATATAILTVVATLAVPKSAGADPLPAMPGIGTALPVAAGEGGIQATITLITGHVVRYVENAAGLTTVTLVSSPPGGSTSLHGRNDADGGYYLIPDEAQAMVSTGVLDRGLFDLKYLAHNGYGDDKRTTTPVIVSYQPAFAARSLTARSTPLAGAQRTHELESISGESLAVAKAGANAFWKSLVDGGTNALQRGAAAAGGGVRKVWLDRKMHADLHESVALVGAPEAWAAGYDGTGVKVAVLDTGIDVNHADLVGKVVASRSFVPGVADVSDGHGHGTHVAATVAGSGAASGGLRKGVAPGAQLLVGKVLADGGSGDMSWAIEGMEWAVQNGARIVSLSLGSGPTDGTDPSSIAVNELTASTGALFVIAAGNNGPGRSTVSAPSVADAALSVAMTDKKDQIDSRSSRGPRVGDSALKPEIAAPGVGIVAARAAGTSLGTPVDANYTSASGTSMATPHVAGAAAILAQQHPDWGADRLKPTLTSTAKDAGLSVYEGGAGRLDLARAVRQQVFTTTSTVDFRAVAQEQTAPVTKQITYTNAGPAPVTLSLSANLRESDGGTAAPAGSLTTASEATVPAGGTAAIDVVLNPAGLSDQRYSGAVVAVVAASGTRLTVPVGLQKQPPQRSVSIKIIGRPGEPLEPLPRSCAYSRIDDKDGLAAHTVTIWPAADGSNVLEGSGWIPDGIYSVDCSFNWSQPGSFLAFGTVYDPQLGVHGDTTSQWDLAKDVALVEEVVTPLESSIVNAMVGSSRTTQSGQGFTNFTLTSLPYNSRFYLSPTKKPTIGQFRSTFEQLRAAPEAVTTFHGNGRLRVKPFYATDAEIVPKFTANRRLEVAIREDLAAGRDVRGKLVIVDSPPWTSIQEEVEQAAAAGAAGVLSHVVGETPNGFGPSPLVFLDWSRVTIPVLWLDGIQAAQVLKVTKGAAKPYVDVQAELESTFEYKLRFIQRDRVPEKMKYKVKHNELATRVTGYQAAYGPLPGQPNAGEDSHTFNPGDSVSFNVLHIFQAPVRRTEYYTVTGPDVAWARNATLVNVADAARPTRVEQEWNGFSKADRDDETVFAMQITQGLNSPGPGWKPDRITSLCPACRERDTLVLYFSGGIDPTDPARWAFSSSGTGWYRLERDGVPVPPKDGTPVPMHTLDSGPATYTLTVTYEDAFSGTLANRVSTEWTFKSQRVDGGDVASPYACVTWLLGSSTPCGWQPLIQLRYDWNLALDGTAPDKRRFEFTVTPWQPEQADPARIGGVKVQASFDDGATWTETRVSKDRNGAYRTVIDHPPVKQTTGAVTIRTEAWDIDGNRVVQTINRAYGLASHRPIPANIPDY